MLPELFSRGLLANISYGLKCINLMLSRSIVGRPRHTGVMLGLTQKDSYIG